MPIEVRELIIRAAVVKDGAQGSASATRNVSGINNDTSPDEEMIKMCVEKVLEILRDKNGR